MNVDFILAFIVALDIFQASRRGAAGLCWNLYFCFFLLSFLDGSGNLGLCGVGFAPRNDAHYSFVVFLYKRRRRVFHNVFCVAAAVVVCVCCGCCRNKLETLSVGF